MHAVGTGRHVHAGDHGPGRDDLHAFEPRVPVVPGDAWVRRASRRCAASVSGAAPAQVTAEPRGVRTGRAAWQPRTTRAATPDRYLGRSVGTAGVPDARARRAMVQRASLAGVRRSGRRTAEPRF